MLTKEQKKAYKAKLVAQAKAIEANKAYEEVDTYDDNFEIGETEDGQYGRIITVDGDLRAYAHRSLKADATHCKLVLFEVKKDKTIQTNSGPKALKAGTCKLVAYPVA